MSDYVTLIRLLPEELSLIGASQALVTANRAVVERMEGKIRATVGRVWGEKTEVRRVES